MYSNEATEEFEKKFEDIKKCCWQISFTNYLLIKTL